jgi:hypothetical protein
MLERRRNRFKRERFLKNRPVGQISADLSVKLIRIDRSFWAGFVGQIEADLAVILERIGHHCNVAFIPALSCKSGQFVIICQWQNNSHV